MKKEAYFKLFGLDKKAGNIAGPFLGGMSGMVAADWLAHIIHEKPGFFTRTLYDLPGAYLGILAGNKLQNKLQDTHRGAFLDSEDIKNAQKALQAARKRKQLEEDKANAISEQVQSLKNKGQAYA